MATGSGRKRCREPIGAQRALVPASGNARAQLTDLNSAEERRLTAARVPTHQVVQAPLSEVLERFELFPNFAVDLGQPPDIPDACDTCLSQNKHQDVGGHILKSEHPGGFV